MKIYDLQPEEEMDHIVGLLHATVNYSYQRLKRIVHGLNQEEIDYRGPDGEYNSIAQMIKHLTVVDLNWIYRIQSSPVPPDLNEKHGPMYDENGKLPYVECISLENLLNDYDQIQNMFRKICSKLRDSDLTIEVPFENGNSATIRWGIWHVADHSRHHQANIVLLKKLFKKYHP